MQRRSRRIARAVFGAALALTLAGAASAAQPPDAWVTTKVKMSLLTTEGVSATKVNVDTIDGRVTLHGSVPTEAEKARAEQVAKQDRWRHQGAKPAAGRRAQARSEDERDRRTGREEREGEPEGRSALADSSITVKSVNAGVVLLAGKAQTLSDAYRAVEVTAARPGRTPRRERDPEPRHAGRRRAVA